MKKTKTMLRTGKAKGIILGMLFTTLVLKGLAQAPPSYCVPFDDNRHYAFNPIYNVSIGTINNPTGNEAHFYGDYTAQSTIATIGAAQNISVYAGGYYAVFIDYNDNGDFTDAGENAVPSQNSGAASFYFASNVPLGAHRMRIISDFNTIIGPCFTFYGEAEDYTVNIICPALMYADADADGYGAGAGVSAICPLPAGYSYVNTDCDDNNNAANPAAVEIVGNNIDDNCNGQIDELNYCSPENYYGEADGIIYNVNIGTINNTTVYEENVYYSDYSTLSTSAPLGSVQTISVTTNSSEVNVAVYIDYDNDGDFNGVGENVIPSYYGFQSGTFSIPSNATSGARRMRVIADAYNVDDPCFNYGGEVEDYTINIGSLCTAPTVTCAGNQSANTSGACNSIVSYSAAVTGASPVLTYTFSGATIDNGTGTGSGSSFNKGITMVSITATNDCGSATCSFNITVSDNQAPNITAPADVTQCSLTSGVTVSLGSPTGSDNCGSVTFSNNAPATFGFGTTSVTWTANDGNGNIATAIQHITINQTPTGSSTNIVICAGASSNLTLNSNVVGTSFTWTSSVINGLVTGNQNCSTGCGTTIADALNNTTTVHGVVEYNVTPTANGCAGSSFTVNVTIGAIPAVPGAISGPISICGMTTATYSVNAVPEATNYIWHIPGGMTITSGQGTSAIHVTIPGGTLTGSTITVKSQNACETSDTSSVMVTKKAGYTGPISGPSSLCGMTTAAYSVAPVFGATSYAWTLPSGITLASGTGTNSVVVNVASTFATGNISVIGSNPCGAISGAANTLAVYGKVPTAPNVITGVTAVCGLSTIAYTASVSTGGTGYFWTLPSGFSFVSGQGTSSIVVTNNNYTTGSIAVAGTNGCGTGANRTLALSATPPAPGVISGPALTCGLTSATYSVVNTGGYTYNWTFPAGVTPSTITGGASSVNVTFTTPPSGTITVKANNGCLLSSVNNLTISKAPGKPITITGPIAVCGLATASYSIAAVPGATSYLWVLPTGMTGSSTTTSITVTITNPNMPAGLLRVYAVNSCGNSTYNSITVAACPSPISMNPTEGTGNSFSSIYPNPTTNEFTIDVTTDVAKDVVVEVYDILGNIVLSKKAIITQGQSSIKTNIEQLNKGIYFVRLTDGVGEVVYTQRVIKE